MVHFLKMNVSGQTKEDIILNCNFGHTSVPIFLGKVIVVPNLGCDMLLGEPAKKDNRIITVPHEKTIYIHYNGDIFKTPYVLDCFKIRLFSPIFLNS